MEENKWRDDVGSWNPAWSPEQEDNKITFLDEGKKEDTQFGASIIFNIKVGEEERTWFVNPKSFNLLSQLRDLGALTNRNVTINRTGEGAKDTRYIVTDGWSA